MYLEQLFGLKGKTAVVTGAGRGIGKVVAIGLAKAGAKIVSFSRTGADDTVREIRELGGQAHSLLVDVTNEGQVTKGLEEALRLCGSLDIVFNNAGVCVHVDTFDDTIEQWREVIDINLTGEYIVARVAGKLMYRLGIKGSIINMASDTPQELRDAWMPLIPQQRMGDPEELIPAVLYLASDASGYTTGSDVIVDGGYAAR